MKQVTRTIVEAGDTVNNSISCVASVPVGYDNEYFNSYSHFGIHHEMLNVGIIVLKSIYLLLFCLMFRTK